MPQAIACHSFLRPCPMALPTLGYPCFKVLLLAMSMMTTTAVMMMVTKMRTGTTSTSAHLSRKQLMVSPRPQPRFLRHLVKPHRSCRMPSDPHRHSPSTVKTGTGHRFTTTIATRACLFRQKCPSRLPTHSRLSRLPSRQSSHHPFAIHWSRNAPCQRPP